MSPLMPPQQAAVRRYSARCQYRIETVSPISPALQHRDRGSGRGE
jgi:hypothetical protein